MGDSHTSGRFPHNPFSGLESEGKDVIMKPDAEYVELTGGDKARRNASTDWKRATTQAVQAISGRTPTSDELVVLREAVGRLEPGEMIFEVSFLANLLWKGQGGIDLSKLVSYSKTVSSVVNYLTNQMEEGNELRNHLYGSRNRVKALVTAHVKLSAAFEAAGLWPDALVERGLASVSDRGNYMFFPKENDEEKLYPRIRRHFSREAFVFLDEGQDAAAYHLLVNLLSDPGAEEDEKTAWREAMQGIASRMTESGNLEVASRAYLALMRQRGIEDSDFQAARDGATSIAFTLSDDGNHKVADVVKRKISQISSGRSRAQNRPERRPEVVVEGSQEGFVPSDELKANAEAIAEAVTENDES